MSKQLFGGFVIVDGVTPNTCVKDFNRDAITKNESCAL